eukprot:CAMPEP_0198230946 /NCGR_PEP_ID=MMETSP1445-20131203/114940_1 /TAXON_ID=36898 /ORGANISM="Pyramimonas sp., Strain CCMP2087" /LENGTH=77 /DNA_ID=CAMNT_0043911531 /DNA_START=2112 /DNA_END=2345 /DNA_ORIENTATION=-
MHVTLPVLPNREVTNVSRSSGTNVAAAVPLRADLEELIRKTVFAEMAGVKSDLKEMKFMMQMLNDIVNEEGTEGGKD